MEVTIGKWRRLQQASSNQGTFTILAIDHRGPLRHALASPAGVVSLNKAVATFKQEVVRELAPECSAVLLDPETGVAPCLTSGALPGQAALIVAMDTGSTGDPAILKTHLIQDWSVQQSSLVGASGVKLLVYYHPNSPSAAQTEALVKGVGLACAQHDVPLYLEPLSFKPEAPGVKLSSDELKDVVIESARRLTPFGADVLKAEFPYNISESHDLVKWQTACSELSQACPVPWVLLSAGVPFDTFLDQARVACESGASGVMAGRAVWNEAASLDSRERTRFLRGSGLERIKKLRRLCDTHGRSFMDICQAAQTGSIDARELSLGTTGNRDINPPANNVP